MHFHFRESSRVVFIPFELPRARPDLVDDTELLDRCRDAGDAVPLFIKLGKIFEGANREEIYKKVSDLLLEKEMEVSVRIKRTYTILLMFTLKVSK